ncbi:fructose-1-phosphate kinase [Sphaerochaeta associata]|nr:fructose-1-phosphate kinase [Sphaerochaeta associata]
MNQSSILTICLSPTFQKMLYFNSFHENEVNRCFEYNLRASGKGINVTRGLSYFGHDTLCLTQLGGCRIEEYLDLCHQENINIKYVDSKAQIRTCTTIINRGGHTSTELIEENSVVSPCVGEEVLALFRKEILGRDAVVISGTKAPGFEDSIFPQMVRQAKELGKLVVLDIKGEDLKNCLQFHPDIIKPNLSEFISTFVPESTVFENEDTEQFFDKIEAITGKIYRDFQVRTVLTRGKFDTWVYDGLHLVVIPNKDTPVLNTIGCGDALTAAMTHSLLNGKNLVEAVKCGMEYALQWASGNM